MTHPPSGPPDSGSPPTRSSAKGASVFVKLGKKITSDESGGLEHRFEYGAELLKARAGRERLPKGYLADRIAEMCASGLGAFTERELQRYMKLAEVYPTKAHKRHAVTLMGSWREIVEKGFPEVTVDESLFEIDENLAPPDAWEQLTLLPGFQPTVKISGKDKPIGDMTVPEAIAYREKSRTTHESYGKWLAQIDLTVDIVIDGWDGDPEAKALDAYRRGLEAAA